MKRLLLLVLMIAAVEGRAQNWNPLPQVGVKRYFVNEIGYLRGMRVDSITVSGGDSVWYPFRSPRGPVSSGPQPLDPNVSSWLGKAVYKRPDGTWLFNTWKNDTVIVKSLAAVGDTWRFFDDTAALWYRATLTNVDTQTVLGILDSIKTITLAAMSGTSPLLSDSLDGWTITLSKHYGFVSVPDLHMLPYPKNNASNVIVDDELFSLAIADVFVPPVIQYGSYNNVSRARFSLIHYQHPTRADIYSTWQPGDAAYYYFAVQVTSSHYGEGYYIDTVTALNQGPSSDTLSRKRWQWFSYFTSGGGSGPSQSVVTTQVDSTPLVVNTKMPEEANRYGRIYYNPHDTTYSRISPAWDILGDISPVLGLSPGWEPYYGRNIFKAGVGHVYYNKGCGQFPCTQHRMLAYRIGGVTHGTPFGAPNVGIPDVSAGQLPISLSPVPASSLLRIHHPATALSFSFTDVTGRIIRTEHSASSSSTTDIDVSTWPSGIYTLTATAPDGSRHTQKVLIAR